MRWSWEKALHHLISEAYDLDVRDGDDEAALCVLIALHESLRGDHDLHQLSEQCINFTRGVVMKPVVEVVQTKLWIPPQSRII